MATEEPAGSVGDSSALRGLPQAPGGPAPPAGLAPDLEMQMARNQIIGGPLPPTYTAFC